MGRLQAPPRDDHLKAIGQITVNFALLESTLAFLVWDLIGSDQRLGQIITAELSFRSIQALASSIFRHKCEHDEQIGELEHLLKRISDAEAKRNQIIHSIWAAGDTAEKITRIKYTAKIKKGFDVKFEQYTAVHLMEIADEISELAFDLQTFTIRLHDPAFRKSDTKA
jgi:hypothetical protein